MDTCSVNRCDKPKRANGYCVAHNRRWRLYGDPEGLANPDGPNRLWSRVEVRGDDECWPFVGKSRHHFGYGYVTFQGKHVVAHRVAFYLANGHWPEPMCCHTCDNPPCCNPHHLYEGNAQTNITDAFARGRRETGAALGAKVRAVWKRGDGRAPGYFAGEANPNARLTDEQVVEIRKLRSQGATQQSIADRFGIKQPHVSRLVRGVARKVD